MAGGGIGSVSVSVVPDADAFWLRFRQQTERNEPTVRVRVDANTARARAEIDSLGKSTSSSARDAQQQVHLLRDAILLLGPAAVPIGAVVGGALVGLLPSVAALGLGIAGIRDDMKSGALQGTKYAKDFATVGTEFQKLKQISAGGLLPGIDDAIRQSQPLFADLNRIMGRTSAQLGGIAGHAVPGLISVLDQLGPLFNTIGDDLVGGAAKFEHWASSTDSIHKFVAYVQAELPQVEHTLGALLTTTGHVVQGFLPFGGSVVRLLGASADALNAIPVPVLTALESGALAAYAAFRVYQGITAIVLKVSGAVESASGAIARSTLSQRLAQEQAAASAATNSATVVAAQAAEAEAYAYSLEVLSGATEETDTLFGNQAVAARELQLQMAESFGGINSLFATEAEVAQATAIEVAASLRAQAAAAELTATTVGAAATATAAELEAAGGAARVGWASILGPVAAVAVGLGLLVSMFHKSSSESQEATSAARAYSDVLEAAAGKTALYDAITKQLADNNVPELLAQVNKGLQGGTVTGKQFVTAIAQGGQPLEDLRARLEGVVKAGTSMVTEMGPGGTAAFKQKFTPAAQAASDALKHLNEQYDVLSKQQHKDLIDTRTFAGVASSVDKVGASLHLSSDMARQYAAMGGEVADKNGIVTATSKEVRAAIITVSDAYQTATQTGSELLDSLEKFSKSGATSADRAALISETLKAANGDALNYATSINAAAQADRQLVTDARQAARQVGKNGESIRTYLKSVVDLESGTLRYHKAAAGPLIADLNQIQQNAMAAAQAEFQHARATMSGKNAADAAYKVYEQNTRGALLDQAKQLGITSGEAKKLADRYFGIPSKVKTLIESEGADPIISVLNRIGKQLSYLTHQPWKITADAKQAKAEAEAAHQKWVDAASKIAGLRPEMDAIDKPILSKLIDVENHLAAIKDKTITIRGVYVPPSGNIAPPSGRQRAGGGTMPPGYATVGEEGWEGAFTDSLGRTTIIPHEASMALFDLPDHLPGYASGTMTKAQLATLRGTVSGADAKAYAQALTGSIYDVGHAFTQMLADAQKAGLSDSLAAVLKKEDAALQVEVKTRNDVARQLKAANTNLAAVQQKYHDEVAAVQQATSASIDITSIGQNAAGLSSFGSILAAAKQQETIVKQYTAGLRKLAAEGLGKTSLRQLAEAGPSALPQVLALEHATPKQLAQLNAVRADIAGQAAGIGKFVGKLDFGKTLASDKELVASLKARDDSLNGAIGDLGTKIERQIEKAIGAEQTRPVQLVLSNGQLLAKFVQSETKKLNRR